ncbi:MAG: 2Fe-2S iron-sulfur cluster binding domain-containing protein, partial [Hydrogenophaga sp.]|nr:2Fe-2S iron-sulfur cluster binding domain-containing protein [Hydrogenophaga sp.]
MPLPAPTHTLVLHGTAPRTLQAAPDQTLLQVLLHAGVPWPVSCRNGTCRRCIGQLA